MIEADSCASQGRPSHSSVLELAVPNSFTTIEVFSFEPTHRETVCLLLPSHLVH